VSVWHGIHVSIRGACNFCWRGISRRVLLTGLMMWRMTVQNCWRGWCRGGSTRFSYRNLGEEDAWSACSALVRVGSAVVGECWRVRACRTSVLRRVFTSGFGSSSSTRWYGYKHVLTTLISGFGSNTFFFKNKLWYQLLGNSRNQTHTNLRGSATYVLHGATGLY